MELTTMQMYWLVTLDAINSAALMVIIISIAFSLVVLNYIPKMDNKEEQTACWEITKALSVIAVISGLLFTFLPSTKQMAAIMILSLSALAQEA